MSIQSDAPSYILGHSPSSELRLELLDELTARNFVEALRVLPKKNVRLLIIGCGSGHLEARLSDEFFDSHFVGIDVSAKRIDEARRRTGALKCSNSYEFIQADLTTLSVNDLKPCDILISRFVLSHLSDPLNQLKRLRPLVRPGGFICLEELASDGKEYYCNIECAGYRAFVEITELQRQAQKSLFDVGFRLLTEFTQASSKVLHCHLTQAILRSARHKAILRLGIEEAKPQILKQLGEKRVEEIMRSLRSFEQNELAFGLYTRSLAMIAQTQP
jgi:ubiquinone/menaquinone biosynthesis C-methylase UbiE